MPLKVNVGLSKKVGQPNYGSLGASCHVEYEADGSMLNTDLEGFQRQVKNAFIACKQAVQDELHRQQAAQSIPNAQNGNGQPPGLNGIGHDAGIGNANSPARNGQAASAPNPGQRRTNGRKATVSQLRALEAIGNRLQLNIDQWLHEKYGIRVAAELSIAEASAAIDELNSTTAEDGVNP